MMELMLHSNPRKTLSNMAAVIHETDQQYRLYICYCRADFSKTKKPTHDAAFEDHDDGG